MMSRTLQINRGDAEARSFDQLSDRVIGACIDLPGLSCGLLVNFNVPVLKQGIKRLVNNFPVSSASPRLRGSFTI